MTIGRRADPDDEVIERASRILAKALGYGSPWYATTVDAPYVTETHENPRMHALAICSPGPVTEQAAWSVEGSRHVRRQRMWRYSIFSVSVPVCAPDYDAVGALSMAKLDGPQAATLLLFTTGDVGTYWPTVERYGLACVRNAFASEALTDAVQRILCGRAAISMDDRAKKLGVRASVYRALTRSTEMRLHKWLVTAAKQFLKALGDQASVSTTETD